MDDAGRRRVAAIDCGTNSLRLLIADWHPDRGELAELIRRMEIVRLGQGVDATGRLAPEALARTFAMLEEYEQVIDDSRAEAVRLVATSATRDASNAADFASGVRRILGVPPEVLTGDEEAHMSFLGATAELAAARRAGNPAPEPPFLVVDIGGGSTEFVYGESPGGGATGAGGEGLAALSVNIGSVRLTERHLRADPPEPAQIAAATADIDAALESVAAALPVARARTLVGLAGSVTTLTAVALGMPRYDPGTVHHARLSARQVHDVARDLLSQNHAERAKNGAIHPGRVDVISAGALILDRILDRFGFTEMLTSEHDILDGAAWSIVTAGAGTPRPR